MARRQLGLSSPSRQRGLSLVEMMVGVAVGLFIVAGATMLVASQLSENRRLLLETQVQQDLRATADIIARELRRAGYTADSVSTIWLPDAPAAVPGPNTLAGVNLAPPNGVVEYAYRRNPNPGDAVAVYGLDNGVIRQRIGSGSPQALTDANTLRITAFTATLETVPLEQMACPRLCADNTQDCWPTMAVDDLVVTISGEAVSDPAVQRTVVSRVRLRNDALRFNNPGPAGPACP